MQNGYRHENGNFAPETAVGTGAAEPLVNEVEAATAVPTVDETTAGKGGNKPRQAENSDIKPSGEKLADDANDGVSNGQEAEVRDGKNQNVVENDTNVNKPAAEARPTAPQNAKRTKKAPTPAA